MRAIISSISDFASGSHVGIGDGFGEIGLAVFAIAHEGFVELLLLLSFCSYFLLHHLEHGYHPPDRVGRMLNLVPLRLAFAQRLKSKNANEDQDEFGVRHPRRAGAQVPLQCWPRVSGL